MSAAAIPAGLTRATRWPMRGALAMVSGAFAGLSFLYPSLYALAWFAFVPLLFALRDSTPRQAYALGILAALTMQVIGGYWLTAFIANLKGYGALASFALALLFWLYSAHLLALATLAYRWLQLRSGLHETLLWPLLIAATFALFPLPIAIKLGQTQSAFPLALQAIDVTGIYGLDAMIALVNAAVFVLCARAPSRIDRAALAATTLILSAWFGYGAAALLQWDAKIAAAPSMRVGIVQPNDQPSAMIPEPRAGFSSAYPLELAITTALAARDVELVVWPEARYRGYFDREIVRDTYERELRAPNVPVVFQDIERVTDAGRRLEFNAAAFVVNGTLAGHYRKVKRIAFGEYLPLIDRLPFVRTHARDSLSDFFATIQPGDGPRTFSTGELTLVPLICYETTTGDYVARAAAAAPERRILIALSNDSWFGATRAGHQHLHSSVLRAVENRASLVHAINNGPSGVIDAAGRVRFESAAGVAGGYIANVPRTAHAATFYGRHPRLFIGLVCSVLVVVVLLAIVKPRGRYGTARSAS